MDFPSSLTASVRRHLDLHTAAMLASVYMMEQESFNQREYSEALEEAYREQPSEENAVELAKAHAMERSWIAKVREAATLPSLRKQLELQEEYFASAQEMGKKVDRFDYISECNARTKQLIAAHEKGEPIVLELADGALVDDEPDSGTSSPTTTT